MDYLAVCRVCFQSFRSLAVRLCVLRVKFNVRSVSIIVRHISVSDITIFQCSVNYYYKRQERMENLLHKAHDGARVCSSAAKSGHLDVIEWLRTQNLPASWLRHLPDH
jgi:hypothetical protein